MSPEPSVTSASGGGVHHQRMSSALVLKTLERPGPKWVRSALLLGREIRLAEVNGGHAYS